MREVRPNPHAIASLARLSERFAAGGELLDLGVGVAEMAAAFCVAGGRTTEHADHAWTTESAWSR